jgi:hypothetical protein
MLDYVQARLSAPAVVEANWKNRHLHVDRIMSVGSFLNLHCGHNNPFSDSERRRLQALLAQATTTTTQNPPNAATPSAPDV